MFHTGEDLTEDNYRIPWLIWIQLLVLLLLFALLFFFALFPSDTAPSTSDDNDIHQIPIPNLLSNPTLSLTNLQQQQQPQGVQNLLTKSQKATGPSLRVEEIEEEEEEEASSLYFHPCHYFQIATVAFLKCFGLNSTSDCRSTPKHRKRKES